MLPTVDENVKLKDENVDWFYGAKKKSKSDENRTDEAANEATICDAKRVSNRLTAVERKQAKFSLFEESLGCFNVFRRQREALAKRSEDSHQWRVFSFEHPLSNAGQRRYLVSTVERFWRWYEKREDASFYELIPEECPSRLYFDLEFYWQSNPDADQVQLITAFNESVKETLNEVFHMDIDPDKTMVVLDASTKTKFSEHVIMHLPGGCLFPSNVSIKKSFIDVLESKMHASNRAIVWNRDATSKTTLCDTAVYTRNRNFRLYLSSKMGKNNPLLLSKRCRYYKEVSRVSNKQIFLDSLVIPAYQIKSAHVLETVSLNSTFIECGPQPTVLNIPVEQSSYGSDNFIDYMSGYGSSSPFPMLDYHIISINRGWRDDVSIRTWKLSRSRTGGSPMIIYYLNGCRYCFNIGREHRSNHVYWVVDLEKFYCFQKCFDVDCRGTSSNYFPLPYFVRASIPSLKDVVETSLSEGIRSVESMRCDSIAIDLKEVGPGERSVEADSKLVITKRRSESKAVMLENVDSFYDEELDEQLLALEDDQFLMVQR